jgi:hypothetical protein
VHRDAIMDLVVILVVKTVIPVKHKDLFGKSPCEA